MLRIVVLASLAVVFLACSNEPAPRETSGGIRIEGEVVEQLDGPPYSYLRILTPKGEVWAAVPISAAQRPKHVVLANGVLLKHYRAASIGRRFDAIVFGTLESR